MEYFNDDIKTNNKIEMIKELLKKQNVSEEKKKDILFIINYLEYREINNKDDIYLKQELKKLYDCFYK